jgi:hypothetical protein
MSGSRSSSVSTAVVSLSADSPEAVGGPCKLSKEDKDLLLEYLGIDCELPSLGPAGLAILSTLTEYPDLLNLHFHQQHAEFSGENRVHVSGWIIALVNALMAKLGTKRTEKLFSQKEICRIWMKRGKSIALQESLTK